MLKYTHLNNKQSGAAVLVVSMILLLAVSLIVIFASKTSVMDLKMAGNDYRSKEAFSAAETGLDTAIMYADRTTYDGDLEDCDDAQFTAKFPCNLIVGTTVSLHDWQAYAVGTMVTGYNAATASIYSEYTSPFNAGILEDNENGRVFFVGQGQSVDGTGSAVVSQTAAIASVLNNGPVPPIVSPFIDVGGNMTIVANPHGLANSKESGSEDAEIYFSAWTETTPASAGSVQTCKPGFYQDNSAIQCIGPTIADELGNLPTWNQCACRADVTANDGSAESQITTNQMLSENGFLNRDIVVGPATVSPRSPPFDDVYDYIFNISRAQMKNTIAKQIPDCTSLGAASTGVFWSLGDCDINGGTVGSRDAPVIIIVEGDIKFNGGPNIWGLIVGIDPTTIDPDTDPLDPCTNPTGIQITGTAYMHGAMASDCDLDLGAGTYNAIYDEAVFNAFGSSSEFNMLVPIEASWVDGLNE
jgi:hypothetical protein